MRWVQKVKTVSTFPPPDTFNRPAEEIAEIMLRPEVSPLGKGSAIKMVQYFLNRGGRNISSEQRRELEQAKTLIRQTDREIRHPRKAWKDIKIGELFVRDKRLWVKYNETQFVPSVVGGGQPRDIEGPETEVDYVGLHADWVFA
jgi:hypothetical protein